MLKKKLKFQTMNRFGLYIFLFLSLISLPVFSQTDSLLMEINGKKISIKEFENLYTKNLELVQDPDQRDIDNYRNLFIDFKLELEDAYQQKYDTAKSFKRELKQYRDELAKKYLTDEEMLDQLTKEAYERMQEDVKVSHILIKVPEDARPADTLKAYKKIKEIYKKAISGEDFASLAKKYSQDPSAKYYGGNLDYINIFHTVYPFETMAYQTPSGQVSKPFRTRFGYHILKVEDKRKARGEIEVAHIFLRSKRMDSLDAEKQINQIYTKIINKEDTFEKLAKKYSEDKTSARYGGRLRKFGIREMIPEFEENAFSLTHPGEVSKPFKSRYGWHIIQLIKKYPVPSFDQVQPELRRKIARDERAKLGEKKLYAHILKTFPVEEKTSLGEISPFIDSRFFENQWTIPQASINNKDLFVINKDEPVKVKAFFEYLYKHQLKNPAKKKEKNKILSQRYEDFKKKKLFDYYDRHLATLYPEFAQIVNEYKEGLLLFNIKSDKVWNKALQDTLGLKQYYQKNKSKYLIPQTYSLLTGQTHSLKTAKKLEKSFKKGKKLSDIKKEFKKKKVLFNEKKITEKDELFDKLQLKNKKTVRYKDGKEYVVVYVKGIEKAHIPEMDQIKGQLINDYQQYLEQEWLKELKQKYPVKINEQNWQKLREKYKK